VSASEERARLFVALELPSDVRDALEAWRSAAPGRVRGLRTVDVGALHVTLCFLGWRAEREIGDIGAACATAIGGWEPLTLSVGDPVWLPDRRPRVLAVEIEDASDRLAGLQSALSAKLSSGDWYAPETRPFLGHVTVARVARDSRVRPTTLPGLPALRFLATQVTLYRSRLAPSGARYEAQRTIELSGRPGGPS
jgi:RNA 2',3'-cyclic 3'-phosphodiesterase